MFVTQLIFLFLSLSAFAGRPKVISCEDNFRKSWVAAETKGPEEKIRLWDRLIEAPHQKIYDLAVWEKSVRPHWAETKTKALAARLERMPELYEKVIAEFGTVEKALPLQEKRLRRALPKYRRNFPMFLLVAPNFDAKSALTSSDPESVALVLSADSLAEEHANLAVLLPHELFHAYHALVSGFFNDGVIPDTSISVPLWEEGLATYLSGLVNTGTPDADLLLDEKLGKVTDADFRWLAAKFLEMKAAKTLNPTPSDAFKRWFSAGVPKLREGLPNRCGYLLGLRVVRELARRHDLEEMIHWTPAEIESRIGPALRSLADK
jgi:hypothetical protein